MLDAAVFVGEDVALADYASLFDLRVVRLEFHGDTSGRCPYQFEHPFQCTLEHAITQERVCSSAAG